MSPESLYRCQVGSVLFVALLALLLPWFIHSLVRLQHRSRFLKACEDDPLCSPDDYHDIPSVTSCWTPCTTDIVLGLILMTMVIAMGVILITPEHNDTSSVLTIMSISSTPADVGDRPLADVSDTVFVAQDTDMSVGPESSTSSIFDIDDSGGSGVLTASNSPTTSQVALG